MFITKKKKKKNQRKCWHWVSYSFSEILVLSEKYNIEAIFSSNSTKQVNGSNINCNDPETYYKITIFISYLDNFIKCLEDQLIVSVTFSIYFIYF